MNLFIKKYLLIGLLVFVGSNSIAQQVIEAEYFWDVDPGQGSAVTILALDGALDEEIEQLFTNNANIPSVGTHTFNIRIKGNDGSWSEIFSYVMNVSAQNLLTRLTNVVQAEYYWDVDPGQGSGTVILALDGSLDNAIEKLFSSSVNIPANGVHTFNLRVKGNDGFWSNPFSYVMNVSNQTLVSRLTNVVQAEYYWDIDPGQGNGITILALDGNLDDAIEEIFSNSVNIPVNGVHTFNLRVKGVDGFWSNSFSYVMNVSNQDLVTRSINISQAEYFWDTDPGEGNGYPILASDGNFDNEIELLFSNSLNMPSTGIYLFNLRVKDVNNFWSTPFQIAVEVTNNTSTSTIDTLICSGETYVVPSGDESYTTTGIYMDTIPNVLSADSIITINLTVGLNSSSTINPMSCGNYSSPAGSVYSTSGTYIESIPNAIGCDSIITINLTVNTATNSTQTKDTCDSYLWPTNGLTYTNSGTYTHTLPNSTGCDSVITLNLTINSANNTVTQVGNLLISNASGAVYQWVYCPSMLAISGATNQSYTPTVNADYAVVVIENGCSATSNCYTVNSIGLDEATQNIDVTLFPNPSTGDVTIVMGDFMARVSLKLYALDGKLIKVENFENKKSISWNLNCEVGIYYIKVEYGNQQSVLKVFVE